jgi:hypothetical protein
MIRIACLAATLFAGALIPAASAGATVGLSGRISQIVDALHNESKFDRGNLSFSVKSGAGSTMLFKGLAGVQNFNSFVLLNDWVAVNSAKKSVYQGGSYQFTHGALGSYFGDGDSKSVYAGGQYAFTHSALGSYFEEGGEKSPYDGGGYKFTHSALDSYFGNDSHSGSAEPASFMRMSVPEDAGFASIQSMTVVPEPASWAMMIVGMGLAGAVMRWARRAPSFA